MRHLKLRNYTHYICLVVFSSVLAVVDSRAQSLELLSDANSTPKAVNESFGNFTGMVTAGALSYFSANDGAHGEELWVTDGSAAGTKMISDLKPGIEGSVPFSLTPVGTALFFIAAEGGIGQALYRTDGNSITLVKSIVIGSDFPRGFTRILGVLPTTNTIILSAEDAANGEELWKSDGSNQGTVLLKDINTQIGAGSTPRPLATVGSTLFFSASTSTEGTELWKTDGSLVGTSLVKDIANGSASSRPGAARAFGNLLLFSANDGTTGAELYVSDGSPAGTFQVKDLATGSAGSSPFVIGVSGALAYVAADFNGDRELYKTNGTLGNLSLVKDINPGSASSSPIFGIDFAGSLFFGATTAAEGFELWKTNGTLQGTSLVKDILPGPQSGLTNLSLFSIGAKLFFTGNDGITGEEPWTTDGSTQGTSLLKDIFPGPSGSSGTTSIVTNGSNLFFNALDETGTPSLFKTNGTPGGTVKFTQILEPQTTSSSFASRFIKVGSDICFVAKNNFFKLGISCFDKTTNTTREIRSGVFYFPEQGLAPSFLTNKILMLGFDDQSNHGGELLLLDTKTATLSEIVELVPGPSGFALDAGSGMVESGGKIFMIGNNKPGTNNFELWVTNGTAAGTTQLTELVDATSRGAKANSAGLDPVPFKNGVLYSGSDSANNNEPFFSDGTIQGTLKLKEINPSGSSGPSDFVVLGDLAFFMASDTSGNRELWRTNGTPVGTVKVTELDGANAGVFGTPVVANGKVIFLCNLSPQTGLELCRLDDSFSAPQLVKELVQGPNSASVIGNLAGLGNKAMFIADVDGLGFEPWITDGTDAGTFVLKDIAPGGDSSLVRNAVNIEDRIYFSADDGEHGFELWVSDGTSQGTKLLSDLFPGPGSGAPIEINRTNVVGNDLVFTGFRPDVGTEGFIVRDDCGGDTNKFSPGFCGCGTLDTDTNNNGIFDCATNNDLTQRLKQLEKLVSKVKAPRNAREAKAVATSIANAKLILAELKTFFTNSLGNLALSDSGRLAFNKIAKGLVGKVGRGIKFKSRTFASDKKAAIAALQAARKLL